MRDLKDRLIFLASNSPRRRQIFAMTDLNFSVVKQLDVDESYPNTLNAEEVSLYIAKLKAEGAKFLLDENPTAIVVTADTIVIDSEGEILGKPRDIDEAKKMLEKLSGRTHTVVTGVNVMSAINNKSFSEKTYVEFNELMSSQIDYYINKYKPLDKAGAYGIQEWVGAVGIKSITGSFYNVMGLPISKLYKLLTEEKW